MYVLSHSVMSDSLRPRGCSPPGSSVHGIFQVRTLEWVALPFSRGSSRPRGQTHVPYVSKSCLTFYDPVDHSHQTPLSVGFSRQEYWSELPFPSLGDLPAPGVESVSPTLAGRFFTLEPPGKPICIYVYI